MAHTCLIHDATAEPEVWRFTGPDGPLSVRVIGRLHRQRQRGGAARGARRPRRRAAAGDPGDRRSAGRAGCSACMEDYESQRVPVHIVYPSRRNLAPRTRVVMDFLLEQTREIAVLLEQGAEVLT